ncbi:MAG TPA: hypothetical protein H9987_06435 [Candidatus Luteococcus avicola]|nr:hypothetical protein [Candidatus Luteococcus avicola]
MSKVYLHRPDNVLTYGQTKDALTRAGYEITDDLAAADWALTSFNDALSALVGRVPKVLAATIEPRPLFGRPRREVVQGTDIRTYDLSLGDFADVWQFFIEFDDAPFAAFDWGRATKQACMVAGNTQQNWKRVEGDLVQARLQLAQEGVARGLLDIYGKGWEPLPTLGMHRGGDGERSWTQIKIDLLQEYRFNSALENTYLPDYVTEKFWHAVKGACVPIYLGSTWMDRLVDPSLYIDLRRHDSAASVYDELQGWDEPRAREAVTALQARTKELCEQHREGIRSHRRLWAEQLVNTMMDADQLAAKESGPWATIWPEAKPEAAPQPTATPTKPQPTPSQPKSPSQPKAPKAAKPVKEPSAKRALKQATDANLVAARATRKAIVRRVQKLRNS